MKGERPIQKVKKGFYALKGLFVSRNGGVGVEWKKEMCICEKYRTESGKKMDEKRASNK
jgi:hypothetical protein